MGSLIRVTLLTVPAGDAELAADALWAAGASAVEERPGPVPGTVVLVADAAPVELAAGWSRAEADLDDGLDAWRAHARPWPAGPFVVRPPWVPAGATDAIDLVIDPGHAFGSGSHPTTRLALEALARLVTPGCSVLDVGCGSGVLAIAAARLGAGRVDGVDTDPAAHAATAANAAANSVEVGLGELGELPGPYDVVVANIGAATLRDLAPAITARAGGAIVLTGLLADQVDAVVSAYGPRVVERHDDDGWVLVTLGA